MNAQAVNALAGLWLVAAPAVIGYDGPLATQHRILGPVAASCALLALEGRAGLRWLNVPVGLWLLVGPEALTAGPAAALDGMAVGLLLCVLAPLGGGARTEARVADGIGPRPCWLRSGSWNGPGKDLRARRTLNTGVPE